MRTTIFLGLPLCCSLAAAMAACSTGAPAPSAPAEATAAATQADTAPLPFLTRRTPDNILASRTAAEIETQLYYRTWGAPSTLADFKSQWGFNDPGADIAGAVYYNANDLGIGREMHCVSQGVSRHACYVLNYGVDGQGKPDFIGDANSALEDAARRRKAFATVAMTFDPASGVNYVGYGADGRQILEAQLDKAGANVAIPFNCLNCHGGVYEPSSHKVAGASFLPFDLATFKYANYQGYRRADQENEFRRLNGHAYAVAQSQGDDGAPIVRLIDGWYGGASAVNNPSARFNDGFVPAEFAGHETLYQRVIAPYCRECHVAAGPPLDAYNDVPGTNRGFLNRLNLAGMASGMCASYTMPTAQLPMQRFWNSSAPAVLLGELTAARAASTCNPPSNDLLNASSSPAPPVVVPAPPSGGESIGQCLYKHADGRVDHFDAFGNTRSCTMGPQSAWAGTCQDGQGSTAAIGCVQS